MSFSCFMANVPNAPNQWHLMQLGLAEAVDWAQKQGISARCHIDLLNPPEYCGFADLGGSGGLSLARSGIRHRRTWVTMPSEAPLGRRFCGRAKSRFG